MTTREIKGGPTRYYVDALGKYLGGFAGFYKDDVEVRPSIPAGAIHVPRPPQHGDQRWNGAGWDPLPLTHSSLVEAALELKLKDGTATLQDLIAMEKQDRGIK